MTTFSIPLHNDDRGFVSFKVEHEILMIAGSKHIDIDPQICTDIIGAFIRMDFSFVTVCASGVDKSFRDALTLSDYRDKSMIACAFKKRAFKNKGVFRSFVIPEGLSPKVALAKRTLWMAQRCSMLLLFPSYPVGRGSLLAFKSVIMGNKPVFVVPPPHDMRRLRGDMPILQGSDLYTVYPSSLFGIVKGWWCLPPVYADTGYCHESV